MSVETYSPDADPSETISVSASAAKHFESQLARSGHRGVRITLKESGCSGYMYDIAEVDEPASGDITMPLENGVQVYLDALHAAALRGTEVDYTRDGLNQNLRFNNPNATDACGCGESFNIDLSETSADSH
ncbi:MAG: iron-sulfur cluster assembly accessory protein [Gammaproteobacteria bacterium]|uniref:Iron-sulfur cluster assembly accessory protein n=1 Tax=OM182 bacterium MED-G24 TaxID=1986255 RepID=A0A2A5WRT2_9GAMM|nr:iron-sulfur cluster assembly accessory protein [Gammaproteobacteria bacterium]PDH39199.1 MAG: iron-sulfur cluster assembly accessory protein [OM182 bacterium MED-G24]RPG24388.1 MAG: iron-sulfur cluster assembly accessory protein [Gammaproteobacteria bacterium TMED50]|tara:strand:- start:8827 stop:9219 length:393 start_codon:yes stop_codon:yes gene_type:complete